MSFAPFDVQPVADRLRDQVKTLRQVGLAADYAAVQNLRDFVVPSCFVILAKELFEPAAPGHGRRGDQVSTPQRGVVSFGVVTVGRNYREQRGAQLVGEIGQLLKQVRQCLQGWIPDVPGARPLQLRQGDLLQYDNSTALWCDVWTTQIILAPEAATP